MNRAELREKKGIHKTSKVNERWQDVLRDQEEDEDPEDQACLICSL